MLGTNFRPLLVHTKTKLRHYPMLIPFGRNWDICTWGKPLTSWWKISTNLCKTMRVSRGSYCFRNLHHLKNSSILTLYHQGRCCKFEWHEGHVGKFAAIPGAEREGKPICTIQLRLPHVLLTMTSSHYIWTWRKSVWLFLRKLSSLQLPASSRCAYYEHSRPIFVIWDHRAFP